MELTRWHLIKEAEEGKKYAEYDIVSLKLSKFLPKFTKLISFIL